MNKILACEQVTDNYFYSSFIQHSVFAGIDIIGWNTRIKSFFDAMDEQKPEIVIYADEHRHNIERAKDLFPWVKFICLTDGESSADVVVKTQTGADIISYFQSKGIKAPAEYFETKLAVLLLDDTHPFLKYIHSIDFGIPHKVYGNSYGVTSCGLHGKDYMYLAAQNAEYVLVLAKENTVPIEYWNSLLVNPNVFFNGEESGIHYENAGEIKEFIQSGKKSRGCVWIKANTMLATCADIFRQAEMHDEAELCKKKAKEILSS